MKKVIALIISLPLIILGAEWQSLNGPPTGRVDDMSIGQHESQYIIYAADSTHKLYKSENEGEFWDSIVTHPYVTNPTCVITDPNEAWTVYVGEVPVLPNTHCVWKSTDGGLSWNYKDEGITNIHPLCFAMDPQDADNIYLGCAAESQEYSLFFSDDGGANWYDRGNQNVDVNCILVVHEPACAESIFIATSSGIYLSTDGGNTWGDPLQDGNFLSVCNYVDIMSFTRIFYAAREYGHVYRSDDGAGATWGMLPNSPDCPVDVAVQPILPFPVFCATEADYIWRSENNGNNWEQIKNHFCDPPNKCILLHPSDYNTVFVGTEECFYKTTNNGDIWEEKTSGRRITQFSYDISVALPDAIFVSYHGTSTWKLEPNGWTLRFTYPPNPDSPIVRGANNGDVLVDDIDHLNVYLTSEVRMGIDTDYICRSTDGGWIWEDVTPQTLLLNNKSFALDPASNDTIYIVAESCPQFLKSSNYGENWELHTIGQVPYPHFFSIDISRTGTKSIYLSDEDDGVAKSIDGGANWNFYSNGLPIPGCKINAISVDPDKSEIIYAGTNSGIYKSIDYGETWRSLGLVASVKDIEIDHSEPTIVYTILEGVTQDEILCTVDRGRQAFSVKENLPDVCYDVEIDRHYSDAVYITTEKGLYNYTPDFNKSLVSSSSAATSINNGKKMMRFGNDFWVTYESGSVIYVVHSTDGQTWSRKIELGEGNYPSIAVNQVISGPGGPIPGVAWRAKGTSRDTIYFSRRISGSDDWTSPTIIWNSDNDLGTPSFAINSGDDGHLVYEDQGDGKIYYVTFDIYNPELHSPPLEIATGINPSIGYMWGTLFDPEIHVVWESGPRLWYRSKTGNQWNPREFIFGSGSRASLDVTGTVVHVVCERSGDIWQRYAVYFQGSHQWYTNRVSNTGDPSAYPVITGGYACAWVEQINQQEQDYEIYHSFYDAGLGWSGPINISDTQDTCSNYPHIVHKQTVEETRIYFIWTENNNAPFDIEFTSQLLAGGLLDGESIDLPFYVAEGGEEVASLFNLHREGYTRYGSEPYKRIDYDSECLEYQFEMLNPEREYALAAYAYQEGYGNLPITVKVDNILIGNITLPPESLVIYKQLLPENLYADTTINVKIFGNDAVCAALVIYEYEHESGKGGGGPQSTDNALFGSKQFMLNVFPNPAHKEFTVQYTLPKEALINLSIFDVSGRLVSALTNSEQKSGTYRKTVSTMNLPQGVYFIRLNTGEQSIVKKTIFLK